MYSTVSSRRRLLAFGLTAGAVTGVAGFTRAAAASNGISALIAVAQQKAQNASDDALNAAERQRALIQSQKAERGLAEQQVKDLTAMSGDLKELEKLLGEIQVKLKEGNCA